MDRHSHNNNNHSQTIGVTQRGRPVTGKDVAGAKEYFEHFLNATSLKNILGYYRSICDLLNLRANLFPLFYPKLKGHLTSWRAKALWKKFDARASHKCYGKGKLCANTRVLIIGAGPCGLRSAIEAQLLGAKVVVIEKRDRLSRNNVLHLWPFVIEDLRTLGAKKFFGKFCAGSIDHISIRQLQCILLKVALLLGVEVHTEVSFEHLIEPNINEKSGWKAVFSPADHPVSQYEFDVIIGADGKRNTLEGFKRKEFRGKLAIAITANFINKRSEAEARVEEISGVAFIFNQKFFKELFEETGIDLENIVYYKDDTHYFVMTAKKPSLIEKGVIKQDLADTERLLAPDNVNRDALMDYAREAANFSTNYQLPDVEFAVNHYGQPDVAMFDFTSMYAAENASKVVERNGYRLLMILVGDSLLEPFWPTGSGCARGFLSSMDAAWAIRSWNIGTMTPLDVLAERESIYRLLAQTTPDNLNKDWKAYTLDPATRYPNLNKNVVLPHQTSSLFDTDNPKSVERMRRNSLDVQNDVPKKKRKGNVDNEVLLNWISEQIKEHNDIVISDLASVFKNGQVLCAILNHYRPDLLDYNSIKNDEPAKNNQLAIDILEKEIGISPIMTALEITNTDDYLSMATYLTQIYDHFRCQIPHIKHPKVFPCRPPFPTNFEIELKQKIIEFRRAIDRKQVEPFISERPCKSSIFFAIPESIPAKRETLTITNTEAVETLQEIKDSSSSSIISDEEAERRKNKNRVSFCQVPTVISDRIIEKNMTKPVRYTKFKNQISPIKMANSRQMNESNSNEGMKKMEKHKCRLPVRPTNIKEKKIQSIETNIKDADDEIENVSSNSSRLVEDIGWVIEDRIPFIDYKDIHKHMRSENEAPCNKDSPIQTLPQIEKEVTVKDFENVRRKLIEKRKNAKQQQQQHGKEAAQQLSCVQCSADEKCEITENRSESNIKIYKPNKKRLRKVSTTILRSTKKKESIWRPVDLPPDKRTEDAIRTFKISSMVLPSTTAVHQFQQQQSKPLSRHKRHAEAMAPNKANSIERKTRKRRTILPIDAEERQRVLEEIAANRTERQNKRRLHRKLQTEQFLKSMQMLQANAKSDSSQPFEDYSLFVYRQTAPNFEDRVKDLEKKFTYVPDHESKLPNTTRGGGNADEEFVARIKNMEDKWREPQPIEKKPKDLMRAIGKIETSDWNIKEIEKKIRENKMGKPSTSKDKEKVPKWSKEQFVARQTKMEKQHLDRQDSAEIKFADIDKSIKHLELKLKEGTARDLGQNKVASITEKLISKVPEKVPLQKSSSRPALVLPTPKPSELCHFCNKRVYLMERLSAEGRFFHHGCFKCQYCNTQLRLGSYAFDRDGMYGHKFFCVHHYGMQCELKPLTNKVNRKQSQKQKSPEKRPLGVDLLDRVQTPERAEFSNLSGPNFSDPDESLSVMDEDEWTDKNFGQSAAELGSSDDDESSSLSDTSSDDEDAYEEALEEPATKEGTLKWAERFTKRYSKKRNESESDYSSSDQFSYDENSSDDEDSDTATEGEEEIRARELRRQEVRVEPPIVQTDTGTDTEIISDESTSDSSSEIQNSATEISTDSEFQDDPTPTRELPAIYFNDFNVTKRRGVGGKSSNHHKQQSSPKRIQITSAFIQNGKTPPKTTTIKQKQKEQLEKKPINIELKLRPLVPTSIPLLRKTTTATTTKDGYALNRTQSTGGIAAKVSLELKRKYLLGGDSILGGSIQKSGSASTLDTAKLKTFQNNISDCQKLLKSSTTATATATASSSQIEKIIILPTAEGEKEEEKKENVTTTFENEPEGRPRSPLHETSIIVPNINWDKINNLSDSGSDSDDSNDHLKSPNFHIIIPTVKIDNVQDQDDNDDDDIPLDSLCLEQEKEQPLKSITSDKKSLNQPKSLPNIENLPEIHTTHIDPITTTTIIKENNNKSSSNNSTPEGTILTETELSDWARDGAVSDDLNDFVVDDDDGLIKNSKIFDKNKQILISDAINTILTKNLDNIEFMDTTTNTETTTSSDENNFDQNHGYVLFNDDDYDNDEPLDSLNPIKEQQQIENFGSKIITLKPQDLENLKQKQSQENEEDSLLIIETNKNSTTEENTTCSDSTVKNLTEISCDLNKKKDRLEEKLAKIKAELKQSPQQQQDPTIIEFEEHCQRLQSKIEFGNAKDSIDIRKSRRKNSKSSDSPQKPPPDLLIQEDDDVILQKNQIKTPDVLYKKEIIEKERNVNQKLIQEMVMNKMRSENKSLERKKRNRTNNNNKTIESIAAPTTTPPPPPPPDLISTPLLKKSEEEKELEFKTPIAPPRQQKDELKKTAEKLKETARMRARQLSNEELGLSPEEKLARLREKCKRHNNDDVEESIQSLVLNTERRNSLLYIDTLNRKRSQEQPQRTKSITEINDPKSPSIIFKSDPNLLDSNSHLKKNNNNNKKDSERRKSLTKLFTNLFTKKSPNSKGGLFSKISPKAKEKMNEPIPRQRRNSLSEYIENNSPPPVPPLPLHYRYESGSECEEGDDDEDENKKQQLNKSSCDTIDESITAAGASSCSSNRRTSNRVGRKAAAVRQTQLKRHRMAQEIQRKLEETEVKTKELEERGVFVEKALRGEEVYGKKNDESDLLQEYFDLMRDRTELTRYEKELMVRAQELELEDRHARLQHDLRERFQNNEKKTPKDVEIEGNLISEMMEIVAKRDSLIALLEEDRQRYSNEDRDFEEQMLAKGLQLTPIRKQITEK